MFWQPLRKSYSQRELRAKIKETAHIPDDPEIEYYATRISSIPKMSVQHLHRQDAVRWRIPSAHKPTRWKENRPAYEKRKRTRYQFKRSAFIE